MTGDSSAFRRNRSVYDNNMSEATTPRLMAAAKEFNVGKDTLVDFLIG